jgi:FYVE zinc finger
VVYSYPQTAKVLMSSYESSSGSSSSVDELSSTERRRRPAAGSAGLDTRPQSRPQQSPGSHGLADGSNGPSREIGAGFSSENHIASEEPHRWPEHLRDHTEVVENEDRDIVQRNADRKRRLTNSAHNSGRVRTVSGGFHSRNTSSLASQPGRSSSSGLPQSQQYSPHGGEPTATRLTGFRTRETAPMRRHSSNMRRRTSSTREIVLPKWQPDSQVAECPICGRQFTFWFRKHHCRKCGRVVCASCSPHRITIPRQFIVHPPQSTSTLPTSNPVVIDLTGGSPSTTRSNASSPPATSRRTSYPSLGGGEEVRLCNPCVPDPQPSPQATMDLAEFLRSGAVRDEPGGSLELPLAPNLPGSNLGRPNLYGQQSPSDEARELRRQRGRGMIVSTECCPGVDQSLTTELQFQPDGGNLNAIQTRAEEIPDESLPEYGNFNYTVIPNYNRRDHPPRYHSHQSPTFFPPGYNSHAASTGSVPTHGQSLFASALPVSNQLHRQVFARLTN